MTTILFIFDIIMTAEALILAYVGYKAYIKTKRNTFFLLIIVALLFALADLLEAILRTYNVVNLDKYGFHELITIVLLGIIIFMFKPSWQNKIK